jgi:hypothetical protein
MQGIPPPTGLPVETGLAFDSVTLIWGFTALVMLAGLGLLLWALRVRDRVTYRLQCPVHGTEAVIEIYQPRGARRSDVTRCSLCDPPARVDCEKGCLKQVA